MKLNDLKKVAAKVALAGWMVIRPGVELCLQLLVESA